MTKSWGYTKKWLNKNPWWKIHKNMQTRCTNQNSNHYHRYGGRGIKNLMTVEDVKQLWIRDNASMLKNPSIDRIDNDGNYEVSNCRFIERSDNNKRLKSSVCKICHNPRDEKLTNRLFCREHYIEYSKYHREKHRDKTLAHI